MIDSGADLNVVVRKDWERLKEEYSTGAIQLRDMNTNPNITLQPFGPAASWPAICTFGAWIGASLRNKPEVFARFVAVEGGRRSLLGRETATQMKMLALGPEVNSVKETTEAKEFPAVPNVEIDFEVDESVLPVRTPYVSIPIHFRDQAVERLNEMEATGIIEKAVGENVWISGMNAVPKGKTDFPTSGQHERTQQSD